MIYFIKNREYVKIGSAIDVNRRFIELQIGSPVELELLCVVEGDKTTEKEYQKQFSEAHVRGEWFYYDDALIDFISECNKENDILVDILTSMNNNRVFGNRRDSSDELTRWLDVWGQSNIEDNDYLHIINSLHGNIYSMDRYSTIIVYEALLFSIVAYQTLQINVSKLELQWVTGLGNRAINRAITYLSNNNYIKVIDLSGNKNGRLKTGYVINTLQKTTLHSEYSYINYDIRIYLHKKRILGGTYNLFETVIHNFKSHDTNMLTFGDITNGYTGVKKTTLNRLSKLVDMGLLSRSPRNGHFTYSECTDWEEILATLISKSMDDTTLLCKNMMDNYILKIRGNGDNV